MSGRRLPQSRELAAPRVGDISTAPALNGAAAGTTCGQRHGVSAAAHCQASPPTSRSDGSAARAQMSAAPRFPWLRSCSPR